MGQLSLIEPLALIPLSRPLQTKKNNIGTKENPKMVVLGNYRDLETVTRVVDFLKECEDSFPKRFLKNEDSLFFRIQNNTINKHVIDNFQS